MEDLPQNLPGVPANPEIGRLFALIAPEEGLTREQRTTIEAVAGAFGCRIVQISETDRLAAATPEAAVIAAANAEGSAENLEAIHYLSAHSKLEEIVARLGGARKAAGPARKAYTVEEQKTFIREGYRSVTHLRGSSTVANAEIIMYEDDSLPEHITIVIDTNDSYGHPSTRRTYRIGTWQGTMTYQQYRKRTGLQHLKPGPAYVLLHQNEPIEEPLRAAQLDMLVTMLTDEPSTYEKLAPIRNGHWSRHAELL